MVNQCGGNNFIQAVLVVERGDVDVRDNYSKKSRFLIVMPQESAWQAHTILFMHVLLYMPVSYCNSSVLSLQEKMRAMQWCSND